MARPTFLAAALGLLLALAAPAAAGTGRVSFPVGLPASGVARLRPDGTRDAGSATTAW